MAPPPSSALSAASAGTSSSSFSVTWASPPAWLPLAAACLAALAAVAALEQAIFTLRRLRYGLDGPRFVIPFVGAVVEMVMSPYAFWERLRRINPHGLVATNLIGAVWDTFAVFVTDPDAARKVLMNNGPDDFSMVLHPSGVRILGPNNIAFQHGARHKALRNSFLPLFGRKALCVYLDLQEELIRRHLDMWVRANGEMEVRPLCRELNQETSQTVFVGPYLEDPNTFGQWYTAMTEGFMCLPIYFPGTGLWRAVRAREKVVDVLTTAAAQAKQYMAKPEAEPRCLLDFWAKRIVEESHEASTKGEEAPEYTSDCAMAEVLMDFLFASQDASTASLVWCFHYLSEYPEVLARVRAEQARVRPNGQALTYEIMEQLVYTRQVVKEILRIRPPPPMVPNVAGRDIQLTESATVPKGTVVIPSLWSACMQGFPEPEKFDPDRMDPNGRAEDIKFRNNFLTFGCGPHMCVGREYAINQLVAFMSLLSSTCEWTRRKDGLEHQILYLPTLYPASCLVTLAHQAQPAAVAHAPLPSTA